MSVTIFKNTLLHNSKETITPGLKYHTMNKYKVVLIHLRELRMFALDWGVRRAQAALPCRIRPQYPLDKRLFGSQSL